MIELRFETYIGIEIISGAERWPMAQPDVIENTSWVRIDVLISKVWPSVTKLFGEQRIERRHVVDWPVPLVRMAEKKSLT